MLGVRTGMEILTWTGKSQPGNSLGFSKWHKQQKRTRHFGDLFLKNFLVTLTLWHVPNSWRW